jgi:tRNA(Ile)-lysidine synthase
MLGPCSAAPGTTILIACSGGPDSLALLAGLAELRRSLRLRIVVAHLDHGMRTSSTADARAVSRRAAALGLPCVIERAGGRRELASRGLSGEAGLRELRREFLARTARQVGAGAIAIGHTADDQAETLLLRLVRGTGLDGLACMRPRRGRWIRPLLGVGRAEVREFLRDRGLRARVDPSNRDRRLARNRIRLAILPELRRINPAVTASLVAAVETFASLRPVVRRAARRAFARAGSGAEEGAAVLVRATLLRYPRIVREGVIREAWKQVGAFGLGLTRRHLAAVEHLLARGVGGSRVMLPGGGEARLERGLLYVRTRESRRAGATPGA